MKQWYYFVEEYLKCNNYNNNILIYVYLWYFEKLPLYMIPSFKKDLNYWVILLSKWFCKQLSSLRSSFYTVSYIQRSTKHFILNISWFLQPQHLSFTIFPTNIMYCTYIYQRVIILLGIEGSRSWVFLYLPWFHFQTCDKLSPCLAISLQFTYI